mgnify:CR=1 FL=1
MSKKEDLGTETVGMGRRRFINTAALAGVPQERRGTVSGLLALSRNVGLIAGASLMGAVFALGAGTSAFAEAMPSAVADGMRLTFLVAAAMMVLASGIVLAPRLRDRQVP